MHSTGEMNVWMSHSFYAYINTPKKTAGKKTLQKHLVVPLGFTPLDDHTFVIIYIHAPIKTFLIFITIFE